jgi:hypothetical protein
VIAPGSEPSLPKNPLRSRRLQGRLGTNLQLDELPSRGPETERQFYGPWYQELSDKYRLRVLFPLWAERQQPSRTDPARTDRASMFGPLYYNRRSAERADDILFPLFWNMNDLTTGSRTTVVGPFVNRVAPNGATTGSRPVPANASMAATR